MVWANLLQVRRPNLTRVGREVCSHDLQAKPCLGVGARLAYSTDRVQPDLFPSTCASQASCLLTGIHAILQLW